MTRRRTCGVALGAAAALTLGLAAHADTTQAKPQSPAAQTQETTGSSSKVTVEGCLMREQDVLGPGPLTTERAFYDRDHILTQSKMITGSAPAGVASAEAGQTPTGTTGGASTVTSRGPMYDVEGIDRERLEKFVGRRVQIEGTFENLAVAQRDVPAKRADDLVEIRGTSIREVPGECEAPRKAGERKPQ